MKIFFYLTFLVSTFISVAYAGEPRTFITKGVGSIMSAEGIFTAGKIEKDVAVPEYINIATNPKWAGLTYDSDSKSHWTHCRLPLADGKSLVFVCKATS